MNIGIALPLVLAALLAAASAAQQAWLYGIVLDKAGAAIPGISLSVRSADRESATGSGADGTFNCELPPGLYTVTAEGPNIIPYRSATVTLHAGEHKYLTIRPIFHAPSDGLLPDPTLKYEMVQLADPPGGDLVVRYASSIDTQRGVVFHGDHLMLSVDNVEIFGAEASCSRPVLRCTIRGAVTVDTGSEHFAGTTLDFDAIGRRLTLTRAPTVVRKF